MPFAAERFDVLPNDGSPTVPTLGRSSLGPSGLAFHAPRIPIFLDVCHALLKWVATLGTEEMAVVPVLAKSDNVLSENGCRAVFTTGSVILMPVEVTEETQTIIAILGHGHPW